MANLQERFGRKGKDKPSLIEEVPILGRRIVEEQTKGMLPAHTLKYYQLVYVEQGALEVWVKNRFYTVQEQELIVVRPYETMAYINGVLPKGKRNFIQIDFEPFARSLDRGIMDLLYRHLENLTSRVLKVGDYFSQPHNAVLAELRNEGSWSKQLICKHYEILFINLIRLFEGEINCDSLPFKDLQLLNAIDKYIEANLNVEISILKLSELAGVSENYFRVQFKKMTGMSPLKYVNLKRIDAAKEMLLNQELPITEIAFDLGFSSCQYFSTFFKKQTSLTPDEFRKEALEMLQNTVQKSVVAKDAAAQMDAFFKTPDQI